MERQLNSASEIDIMFVATTNQKRRYKTSMIEYKFHWKTQCMPLSFN